MAFLGKSKGEKNGSQQNALGGNELPLQTKLRYGQADDSYEKEADSVADTVVNNSSKRNAGQGAATAPSISNFVQKQEAEENKETGAEAENEESKDKREDSAAESKDAPQEDKKEPVQKKEDGKKDEEKPVQKKEDGKKDEEKPVQKKEDGKKEEEKPVQKKSTDNKEDDKQVQKKEEANKKDEEKPVQKKDDGSKKDEEKPVQKKDEANKKDEEKPVQKKEAGTKDEEKPVQKREANNPKAQEPAIEKQIMASKTGGKPLEDDVRKEMEKQFSKDFKNVVIHNNPMSYELCTKLNAQAFTHGNHIYFAEGKYKPDSTEGKRLLAHELTHVVQQGNELKRKMIQKEDNSSSGSSEEKKTEFSQDGLGSLKKAKNGQVVDVTLDHIKVPNFKSGFALKDNPFKHRERKTAQIKVWEDSIKFSGAKTKLDTMRNAVIASHASIAHLQGKDLYFLKEKKTKVTDGKLNGLIIGSQEEVLNKTKRPRWDTSGKFMPFDVDHQLEWQLGGEDVETNMWMLEAKQNRSAGSNIKNEIENQLGELTKAATKDLGKLPTPATIRKTKAIKLTNGVKGGLPPDGEAISYSKSDIEGGTQLDGLEFLSGEEIMKNNLLGSENKLALYVSPTGGAKVDVKFDKAKDVGKPLNVGKTFGNLTINTLTPNETGSGTANITLLKGKKGFKKPFVYDVAVDSSPIVQFGGVLNKAAVLTGLNALKPEVPQTSPVVLDMIELNEKGIAASGKMMPSASIFQKLDIEIRIDEDGIWLAKTFSAPEMNIPKPFKIDECSFSIMLGLGDFKAEGIVAFSIENVGSGEITAKGMSDGFTLAGNFKLDPKIFDGEVSAIYTKSGDTEKWKISGTARFKKGAVTGLKSGSITVGYDGKILTADGEAELEGKWIEKGTIGAKISEDSFIFTGTFKLAKMPGIESGEGEVTIENVEGQHQLKAKGKAKSSIKVVDAELSIEYDKGILTVKGSVAYSKGVFSGKIFVTVTNGPPPSEAPNAGGAAGHFRVYGGGELTAQLTSWLKGTIGVTFDENNQVIFSGKLALSSSIEVFGKKTMPEKDLFSMGFDIPIFAIPVGPKSIGLKARIEGALVAYAFIGPGKLEGVELGITYNPDKPEDTEVTGKGKFVIPAEAGLKLAVRASIGLSALIGGVEGGLEVAGGLKLEASASADLDVNWSPSKGLELNANLNADVTPKFIFEITGFIKAWFAWYDKVWKWKLKSYEFGSNLNLGVTLPIKYKSGQDFNVSYEDMKFRKPDIDPSSVLKGLISEIKNQRS
ncbi:eCIS core domain-containing protein [Pseudochryseolinea flava]|uniref:eCIS core domain-containing protein n=1 Tax=Pseudochryseolinea flava TaxID=2059302 RepID=A0A364Y6W7_9BACT|nr:DUF4157 domain-containing protein [Pseudochryseolinea flava]RAW01584.1 hypothetical protein DQQ10_07960 [Pseudochryseolinea flava]